jgi:hypothetical protein
MKWENPAKVNMTAKPIYTHLMRANGIFVQSNNTPRPWAIATGNTIIGEIPIPINNSAANSKSANNRSEAPIMRIEKSNVNAKKKNFFGDINNYLVQAQTYPWQLKKLESWPSTC